jgi:hypothetical protein
LRLNLAIIIDFWNLREKKQIMLPTDITTDFYEFEYNPFGFELKVSDQLFFLTMQQRNLYLAMQQQN